MSNFKIVFIYLVPGPKIKSNLGHETWSLGPKNRNSKNLSEVATLRNLNFKILSMQDIKIAQMRPGSKISAF
jgi:hypothetical protein